MAIGKISGPMLQSNLDRQGIDLQFSTNSQPLVYMDFAQFRMGVNTSSLTETLTVNGNLSTSNVLINGSTISTKSGNLSIGSPIELGSIGDVHITGGSANYLLTTDGAGNLSFIDANAQPGISTLEANVGAYQSWANANLATQTTNFNTLDANVGAYEIYANANIGTIYTHLNTLDANVGAYEIYANANIGTIYTHLNTLDANVGAYESWANANLSTQTTNFDTLNANVGAYQLWANANLATQTTNFDTLYANVGAYEIYANANAATQAGYIDTINSNVAAANTAIATLQTQVYSNANVASYLTVFNGNINAGNIGLSGNLYTDYISANIGNVVSFTGTGAVSIPIGDTAQRPSGVAGYVRYNSDNNQIEYFNGTVWVPVTNTVTDQQITGDGINDTYTLDQSATNVGVLVSINGTLQAPGTAYIVSDNQITFAEVPLSTDIIDVRYLGGTISINSTLSDDLVVSGNLTVSGNIINTNNLYTYGNTQVGQYLNHVSGDIVPSANVTYSLGTSTNQWRDLWVSNNTIYVGNTPISVSNGTLLINNTPVTGGTTYSNANVVANLQNYVTSISTTANITTTANLIAPNFLFANGVNILSTVSASSTYSNTNVSAYLTSQNITSANIGSYQTWANANVSGLYNSITGANTTIQTLNANVGAYEIYANANIGTLYNGNISTQANLGAFQTYANTTVSALQANLGVTQLWANANIASINANIGGFYTWANTNFVTSSYSNTNANALLSSNTISTINTTGNIKTIANVIGTTFMFANGVNILSTVGSTYSNTNVAAYLTAGNISIGNVGYTVLPNTVTQFTSNVNSYGQINTQNINSGSAATTDIIVTANNGTDTVFFADLGIAGSAYNVNSPNNSLGNVIYANDTYLYAQGNTSANIGGNLAIGTSTANRTVKIFAGGINNTSTVATFSNTGIVATGNVTTLGKFVGDGSSLTNVTVSVAGNIQGTSSNVTLVAGNYNFVFDNTGTTTVGNINVTYNPTTTIGTGVVITAGNTIGGTGYADVIKITNNATGSTNPNKTFRLNSTGGLEIIDSTYSNNLFTLTNAGALTIKSTFTPGAYRVGEVIKTTMLYPGDMGISADVSITGGNIATYSYTPVSSSSYIIAEFGGRWEVNGTSIDSWWSNLYVASTQVGTGHMNWTIAGDGTLGRTGGFFPLAGRYTNTDTGIKAIYAQANRDTSDDNFIMRYTSGIGFWMKITEIGR